MRNILSFLNGKKTYLVAIIAAITAAVQALGYTVPEFVYAIEAALGLGAIRIALKKGEA